MRNVLIAASLLLASSSAFAACSIDVEGNDAMQFNVKAIEVPSSCKDFTINLTHSGKMAKNVMGHNVVVTKTTDMQGVANDGATAGINNEYVKPDDARVIAHSKVIGAGEKTAVTFETSKLAADGKYSFFCSFPGHWALMKGTITVK